MTDRPVLSGLPAIAKALGCSEATARRMVAKGTLPAYRTGDRTSPYRVERKSIDDIRRPGRRD